MLTLLVELKRRVGKVGGHPIQSPAGLISAAESHAFHFETQEIYLRKFTGPAKALITGLLLLLSYGM